MRNRSLGPLTLVAMVSACVVVSPPPKEPPAPVPVDSDPPEPSEPVPDETDVEPPPADTGEGDTTVAPPTDVEVCYLGEDRSGQACVPVVAYDASWGEDYAYPDSADARYAAPVRFLDLDALDPALALGPNFVLSEFAEAWKGRFGVVQPHLVDHLQAVRDAIGRPLVVNSGYRNPAYNAGVGGVISSRHQWGDAADIGAGGLTLEEIAARCEAEGVDFVGWYEAHIHCDWRGDPLEAAFFDPAMARGLAATPQLDARLLVGPVWTAPAEGWDEGEPLREWVAYDADGGVLTTATGRTFVPPDGAVTVRVSVGRALSLTQRVP